MNLSIHGRFKDGKQAGQKSNFRYGNGPQEQELSNSPRTKRRRERNAKKAKPATK